MNEVANRVLNEMQKNNSIDAEQLLSMGIGQSDAEVQFYIDSAKYLNLV